MAAGSALKPLAGLVDFLGWVEQRGLPRAAVTNAPKENAQLSLGALGLLGFFKVGGQLCAAAPCTALEGTAVCCSGGSMQDVGWGGGSGGMLLEPPAACTARLGTQLTGPIATLPPRHPACADILLRSHNNTLS